MIILIRRIIKKIVQKIIKKIIKKILRIAIIFIKIVKATIRMNKSKIVTKIISKFPNNNNAIKKYKQNLFQLIISKKYKI